MVKPRNELCNSNDTKVMIPSTDFKFDGDSVIPFTLPPKYTVQDFCLAFGETDTNLELCVSHEHDVKVALFTKTYPICCTVSNVFLVLTFLVYRYVYKYKLNLRVTNFYI